MPSSSKIPGRNVSNNINNVCLAIPQCGVDFDFFKPLLQAALAERIQDKRFWCLVATTVNEYLPAPPQKPCTIRRRFSVSNCESEAEYEMALGRLLGDNAGVFYAGVDKFHEKIFGRVPGLRTATKNVFKQCQKGKNPLFQNGWTGWPTDAQPAAIWRWLTEVTAKFAKFANSPRVHKRPLTQPTEGIKSHIEEKKMDVGFTSEPNASRYSFSSWSLFLARSEVDHRNILLSPRGLILQRLLRKLWFPKIHVGIY